MESPFEGGALFGPLMGLPLNLLPDRVHVDRMAGPELIFSLAMRLENLDLGLIDLGIIGAAARLKKGEGDGETKAQP